eukprot:7167242-Prymnesium_polylepis.1
MALEAERERAEAEVAAEAADGSAGPRDLVAEAGGAMQLEESAAEEEAAEAEVWAEAAAEAEEDEWAEAEEEEEEWAEAEAPEGDDSDDDDDDGSSCARSDAADAEFGD